MDVLSGFTKSVRLVTAALDVRYNAGINYVADPLGEYIYIFSLNEYLG